jgi:hypothetical protein
VVLGVLGGGLVDVGGVEEGLFGSDWMRLEGKGEEVERERERER